MAKNNNYNGNSNRNYVQRRADDYTPQRNPKGKSGAKLHKPFDRVENNFFMTAWKVADKTMTKYKIFQAKDKFGKIFESDPQAKNFSGTKKQWVSVVVVCSVPLKQNVVISGVMNIANHKVYIKDWNWIINPSASNGGYIGKHISKNYNN